MSYFIYIDLISSLLDPKLVDLGSNLIHVGAYDSTLVHTTPCWCIRLLQN